MPLWYSPSGATLKWAVVRSAYVGRVCRVWHQLFVKLNFNRPAALRFIVLYRYRPSVLGLRLSLHHLLQLQFSRKIRAYYMFLSVHRTCSHASRGSFISNVPLDCRLIPTATVHRARSPSVGLSRPKRQMNSILAHATVLLLSRSDGPTLYLFVPVSYFSSESLLNL